MTFLPFITKYLLYTSSVKLLPILILIMLTSCSTKTVLYQRGVYNTSGEPVKLAEFGSNMTGMNYSDGSTSLVAAELDNAESTRAQNELAGKVVDSAGSAYRWNRGAKVLSEGIGAFVSSETLDNETTTSLAEEATDQAEIEAAADVAIETAPVAEP